MSESEFLEVLNLHAANAITSFTVFISYLFGFITAAYIVGLKLTSVQAAIISILYVFSCSFWIVASLTHADSFAQLIVAHPSYAPSALWMLPWPTMALTLGVSALAASLFFLYDVRSKPILKGLELSGSVQERW